jgi:hypothetical protein
MSKAAILGAVAVVAVFAGVYYVARDRDAGVEPQAGAAVKSDPAAPPPSPSPVDATKSTAPVPVRPAVPSDPRLAALMVSQASDLVELVPGEDGRVIKEIDKDPASAGFGKPLREYTYHGDKVTGLTVYRYLGGQTQIIRADVTYKPDGSVDQYRETTEYDHGKQAR